MKCEVCSIGSRRRQAIRYTLSTPQGVILVEHVPAEVCDRCGEVTLTPEVVERLQQTIWKNEPPARMLETPVYEFIA
jgi:YgiT-type zinc finger domain-containing protein